MHVILGILEQKNSCIYHPSLVPKAFHAGPDFSPFHGDVVSVEVQRRAKPPPLQKRHASISALCSACFMQYFILRTPCK